MAKKKGLDWKSYKRLGDLHGALGVTLSDMIELVHETFHEEPYTKKEVCELLEVTEEELNNISLSERTFAGKYPIQSGRFWFALSMIGTVNKWKYYTIY